MDYFFLEDILGHSGDSGSPGAQLYLYRLLQMLASRESRGNAPLNLSYAGARKLAARLGLNNPDRLVRLFKEVGLGTLDFHIGEDSIRATLTPASLLIDYDKTGLMANISGCELERGLIDGMLEIFTGMPVTTIETACWTRGDNACSFEASRSAYEGAVAYRPVAISNRSSLMTSSEHLTKGVSSNLLRSWNLDAISREIARSERHGYQLSLLYVDLDDLGEINARMGLAAGDQVLNAVASSLSRTCRTEDYIWHHGDDEFIIALVETNTGCAEVVARRLNTKILTAAEHVDIAVSISASIGLSTFPTHAENLPDLLSSARSALYLAKSLGKGRTQAASLDEEIVTRFRSLRRGAKGDEAFTVPGSHPSARRPQREDTESALVPDEIAQDVARDEERVMTEGADESLEALETAGEAVVEKCATPGRTTTSPISVIAASVNQLLLLGMKQVLTISEDIALAGEINKPDRLPEIVADIRPDVIFTDIQMASAKRFNILKLMKEENLPCKFIVFVSEVDQDVLRVAADFDADGVVLQSSSPAEILDSIREVYSGRKHLPEEVRIAIDELENNRRLLKELSERELEVLRLIAEGKSNSLISKELYITVNTVRFHLANIYQKLNVSNRTEAANYYLRQGLDANGQTKLL